MGTTTGWIRYCVVRIAPPALLSCVAIAIVIQDHTRALPLGLFNASRSEFATLSDITLALVLAALIVLLLEFGTRRLKTLVGVVRWLIVTIVVFELLLFVADKTVASVNSSFQIGGIYYEKRLPSGEPVVFRKGDMEGTLREQGGTNTDGLVLMLGDSYTEGSGRAPECNYPHVVEGALRRTWSEHARVVNAGVSGCGPAQALGLLRWYLEGGLSADAVVYTMFLENDFTDGLPGTIQRVVAGHLFRFPESRFLRAFHPLNTRTFRWLLFTVYRARAARDLEDVVTRSEGECNPQGEPLGVVTPFLQHLVERRLDGSRRVQASQLATREVVDEISAMAAVAQQRGIPFILVLFPDRALADIELQMRLGLSSDDLAAPRELRRVAREATPGILVVDASEVLEGRPRMYRASDTHLSDKGNIAAGEFVGDAVADYLGGGGRQ